MMRETTYERLQESVFTDSAQGLDIMVLPKPGFTKKYAFFVTNYGSMDLNFISDGKVVNTPAGVAHFLEHKLFDMPDGSNTLQTFALHGAQPNAFTSYNMTAYYFQATENFGENLETLLRFVSTPYFTEESVQKEQGIIGQEIAMIEDNPAHRVFENFFSGLYAEHPVSVPIAGTAESIARITAETLYTCHRVYYHPSNMCLVVAGDVDPESVLQVTQSVLPSLSTGGANASPRSITTENHEKANFTTREVAMEVSLPQFIFGFKCPPPAPGGASLRFALLSDLAMECFCGKATPIYERLYNNGLISRDFDAGHFKVPGCACLLIGGESRDPHRVRDLLLEEAERIGREGFDEELFSRQKNAKLGELLRRCDSPEFLCRQLAESHFDSADYFTFPALLEGFTPDMAVNLLRDNAIHSKSTLSVINPRA